MYLLSDRMHRDIRWRLGRWVKYLSVGGFIWNKETQKFETLDGYSSFQYNFQHFSFCLLILLTSLSIWFEVNFDDLPESDPNEIHNSAKLLAILSNILITTLLTFILSAGFVHLKYKSDFPLSLNQAILLDQKFKNIFLNKPVNKVGRRIPQGDLLVRLICYVPLLFPITFAMSLFHPADPMHIMLTDLFEVEVKPSIFIFFFIIFQMWAVVAFTGSVLVFLIIGIYNVFPAGYWLNVVLPMTVYHRNTISGAHKFRANEAGIVPQEIIIRVYRSFQCAFTVPHDAFCNTRLASHSIGMMIAAVVSAFTLIRYNYILFDKAAAGMSIILIVAFVVVFIMYRYECYFLDEMESRWKAYQNSIMKLTKPSSEIYKVARSFRPITLKTGGPYFNVNRTTYLEWCDQISDKLVTVLVMF